MHRYGSLHGLLLGAALLTVTGCAHVRGSRSTNDTAPDALSLTAFRTRHRYVTASDLPGTPLRVAVVDVTAPGQRTQGTLTVGMLRPAEGFFRAETEPVTFRTLDALIAALDRHIDLMPVGLVMTADGRLAGASAGGPLPPAFGGFVSELQQALDAEEIRYAFILLPELHRLR